MSYRTIDFKTAELALQKADGRSFEDFSQAFYGALKGTSYVPLGGMHDGGAEGFELSSIYADSSDGVFMQASIRQDTRSKIRQTIGRLREVGRDPRKLVYLTSISVPRIDLEEEILSDELGVSISIRDAKFISIHINDSPRTVQAFDSYLAPSLSYLNGFGAANLIGSSPKLPAQALCVFLGQEIERRRGNTELLEAVTDSLILWALEETDPDKGILFDREKILSIVESALPSSASFIRGVLDSRLAILTAKDGTGSRAIRHYKKQGLYCLPYEMRKIARKENAEDELLKLQVSDIFRSRIAQYIGLEESADFVEDVIRSCHRCLEITFEMQGLEMAHFISGTSPDDSIVPSVSDHLDLALDQLHIYGNRAAHIADIALKVLRSTFYDSSECERIYLGKISRTYVMMFLLRNDARIVEYFRTMSGQFNLYIGTDIIIRALSEYFLRPEDQMTINMLSIIKSSGSHIILTEKCLEEVWTHLKASDAEFYNHYMDIEPYVDLDLARCIDRILIRSYFYARINPLPGVRRPAGWKSFIGNFAEYSRLHQERGRDELREYLKEKFGFLYEDAEEMSKDIDPDELSELADKLMQERKRQKNDVEKERRLAENDALHVLRVYQKRKQLTEYSHSNPYGYRTWWLTSASSVRRATGYTVAKYNGRYMMRPEFLLHFIALSPSEEKVRQSYNLIFPTLLGIRLSSRLDPKTFKSAIDEIGRAFAVDEARAKVRLADLSNQLKADFLKRYSDELPAPQER